MAFISATIFSTHPVHTESVSGIVGRADLLYSFFVLLALTTRKWSNLWEPITTTILAVLAVLSKEQGIILIPLLIIHEVCTELATQQDISVKPSTLKPFFNKTPWKTMF